MDDGDDDMMTIIKFVEKFKTCLLFDNIFRLENLAVCDMWKNIVQLDMPQITVWAKFITSWMPKATNTQIILPVPSRCV
jgi:hypothetical protein